MKLIDLAPIGHRVELETIHFSADDIIRYAQKFDPQSFHLDPIEAENSVLGGLCASGWHTSANWMHSFLSFWVKEVKRLKAEGVEPPKLGPSPGFKDLKWLKPVFAGDDITYYVTLLESRPLASRPGTYINTTLNEAVNQNNETVLRFTGSVLEFD